MRERTMIRPSLPTRPLWAELDLQALSANLANIRALAGSHRKIIASIKGNAYGHGAVRVARALAPLGVEMLATGSFEEALAVRCSGVDTDILMFGACEPEGIPTLLAHGLIPTVYDDALAQAAARADTRPARIFIKVDCGFGRLGVALEQARAFVHEVAGLANIEIAGLYTHAPFHDPKGRCWAAGRIAAFGALLKRLASDGLDIPVTQALASAGVLSGLDDPGNAICPGHALYGLAAATTDVESSAALRPVLRAIRARLIHVYRAGEEREFGSGGTRRLVPGTVVGVVPVGLSDGYRAMPRDRGLSMLCNGVRLPVLAVGLEHTSVDLSEAPTSKVGDALTIVGADGGERITLDDVAAWRGTSALEVVTSFSGRIPAFEVAAD